MGVSLSTSQAMCHPIKSGDVYLLVGTDYYWADRISDRIKDRLHKQEQAELIVLYGEEVRSAQLNDYLDSISLFSSAKLILLKNAEQMRKAELDILASYMGNPLEEQTLVISAEKIDARIGAWKKIREAAIQIAVDKPKFAGSIREWLEGELKALQKTMSAKAIEEFISRIELDYSTANNELQKLLLLIGGRKSITENDVIQSLGTTRVGALIDFSRALGKRDLRQSLILAYKMLDSDWEPLQVFFQLQKFYTLIWRIALLKDKHIS
ncbi:MAG TPA: DNA polymerase III subunit delta, partial [Candidatus Cloacimonadota bacterium]|nr:DNA polymerase III subunit delta [Candidatus Cloacimonadota bacterium]